MKKISLVSLLVLLLHATVLAQKSPDANPALTADSLASGNYKDVLNSFFQLSFDKLTGPDKELRFTTTPFAVMAKLDSDLLLDKNYIRYSNLRNLNFDFSLKLDTSYKFNGFSSGVKYALINKRDETVSKAFIDLVENNTSVQQLFTLNNAVFAYLSTLAADPDNQKKTTAAYYDFIRGKKNFNELDQNLRDHLLAIARQNPATQRIADTLAANSNFNINTTAQHIYSKMKNDFNNNLLWTVGVNDTTYKNQFMFSNIVLHSELLKGITHSGQKNDLELQIKTSLQLTDDTLSSQKDLKRSVFSFEPAMNLVIKTKNTARSYVEMKFSSAYYHVFNGGYQNEKKDQFMLTGTLRVRLLNDIWLPLEIKYDPAKGNFLGVFNIRVNFTALGKVAKFLKS